MKTFVYALSALTLTMSTALAEPTAADRPNGPVSSKASDKPSERGDRDVRVPYDRSAPVSLDRSLEFESQPLGIETDRSGRTGWSGNDNEG